MSVPNTVRAEWEEKGQGHVFRFFDELDTTAQENLLNQCKEVDLTMTLRGFEQATEQKQDTVEITPFSGEVTVLSEATDEQKKEWRDLGLSLIGEGKVGVILMAGGQGSRLGSKDPKGMYDVGLPSKKSLFQLQAEHIRSLVSLAGTHTNNSAARLPWYILTSGPTHGPTVAFFEKHEYFGLPKENVFFFQQGTLPCLTQEGKVMLADKGRIAVAPNGNGGLYHGLYAGGALSHMKERGVEYLHCYSVDNILVKIADPYYVGYSVMSGCECSNKVTLKENPHEKVGVMCMRNGKPGVVEYSEISKEMAELRGQDGKLVYSGANIAMHFFTRKFLDEVGESDKKWLPFHIANKKISTMTAEGATVTPTTPNGMKLEMFIFDVFAYARKMACFACVRSEEFSGVKNAPGPPDADVVKDSPDSARLAVSAYHIALATAAGATVNRKDNDRHAVLEISPLVSYDGEGLKELCEGQTFDLPCHLTAKI